MKTLTYNPTDNPSTHVHGNQQSISDCCLMSYLEWENGLFEFLNWYFGVALIVVTSHDAFVDCWLFNLPFRVFSMSIPLSSYMRWVFMSEILCWFPCTFVLGFSVGLYVSVFMCYVMIYGFKYLVCLCYFLFWLRMSDIIHMFLISRWVWLNFWWRWGVNIPFYPSDIDF